MEQDRQLFENRHLCVTKLSMLMGTAERGDYGYGSGSLIGPVPDSEGVIVHADGNFSRRIQ